MRLYDTHCHFESADPTAIAQTLERARAAGVGKLMAVGVPMIEEMSRAITMPMMIPMTPPQLVSTAASVRNW